MSPRRTPSFSDPGFLHRLLRPRHRCSFDRLEDRTLLSTGPLVATLAQLSAAVSVSGGVNGAIFAGESDFYRIDSPSPELLIARVHVTDATTELSLLNSQGNLLTQSDGISSTDPDNLLAQHIDAGTYYLELTGVLGTGSFSLTTQTPGASLPNPSDGLYDATETAIVTGDFNNDGHLDIAIGDSDESDEGFSRVDGVSVLLGIGDGTFRDAIVIPVSGGVTSLAVGDFNGDGRLDLVAGYENYDPNTQVYTGGVATILGNGDGTFQAPIYSAAPGEVTSLAVGDFNSDHRLDIAAGYRAYASNTQIETDGVSILAGAGDGTFQATENILNFTEQDAPAPQTSITLAVGDFNGDGRLDLVAAYVAFDEYHLPLANSIAVYLGNGDGTFCDSNTLMLPTYSIESLNFTESLNEIESLYFDVADFNGDGHLDVVVGINSSPVGVVSVYLGNGDGTFRSPISIDVHHGVGSLAQADFNGDGKPDVVVGSGSGLQVLLGNGDGTFQEPMEFQGTASVLATGDFNGDKRPDIVIATGSFDPTNFSTTDAGSILFGQGDGEFINPIAIDDNDIDPTPPVVGDFNGDGRLDIAIGVSMGTPTGLESGAILLFLGNGDGSFRRPIVTTTAEAVTSLVSGDFNGDGRLDLAAVFDTVDVSVFLGDGAGGFRDEHIYPAPSDSGSSGEISSIAVGDFNGDGHPDIAIEESDDNYGPVTASSSVSILVFLANRDGGFDSPIRTEITQSAGQNTFSDESNSALAVGDFNGDHKLDIVVDYYEQSYESSVFNSDRVVEVLFGNGEGSFGSPSSNFYLANNYPFPDSVNFDLVVGDFNGDGRSDLAVGLTVTIPIEIAPGEYEGSDNVAVGGISIYLGEGDGSFAAPILLDQGDEIQSVTVGEFGGGIRADIAALVSPPPSQAQTPYSLYSSYFISTISVNANGSTTNAIETSSLFNDSDFSGDFNSDGRSDIVFSIIFILVRRFRLS